MREVVTTVLDLLGSLLVISALAVLAARLTPDETVRALAVAGLGTLAVSWLTDLTHRPRGDRR